MEIGSLGTLSKIFKNLSHQLPEKARISQEMGLNIHSELSSWLEAIVYLRNIIAHQSRLWSRNMVKVPKHKLNNPRHVWLSVPVQQTEKKKVFLNVSSLIYLCNVVTPNHRIKTKIINLLEADASMPIHKIGFIKGWRQHPLWS